MASWLLQANPDDFSVDAYFSLPQIYSPYFWKFAQSNKTACALSGDVAFIWRAGGKQKAESGVIGVVHLVGNPEVRDLSQLKSAGLWKVRPKKGDFASVIEIEVDQMRLSRNNGMIPREILEGHPDFISHPIFTVRQGTEFSLTDAQMKVLLAERKRRSIKK